MKCLWNPNLIQIPERRLCSLSKAGVPARDPIHLFCLNLVLSWSWLVSILLFWVTRILLKDCFFSSAFNLKYGAYTVRPEAWSPDCPSTYLPPCIIDLHGWAVQVNLRLRYLNTRAPRSFSSRLTLNVSLVGWTLWFASKINSNLFQASWLKLEWGRRKDVCKADLFGKINCSLVETL